MISIMDEVEFRSVNLNFNSNSDQVQNTQFQESPKSPIPESGFNNIIENIPQKEEPLGVIEAPKKVEATKLQKKLDQYIQDCLNKYKPLENPDPSLYKNTSEKEKDLIISKKSTIPDLVIWNKTFNKNECYADADSEINSDFPRFRFYLRLGNKDKGGKNKNEKNTNKDKKKKNKKDKNNNMNHEQDIKGGVEEIIKEINNLSLNNDKKDNNNNNNNAENKRKKEKKKKNNKNKENKANENQNKFNLMANNVNNNKYDNLNNMNNMNNTNSINNNNFYQQKIGLDNNMHKNNQINNLNLLNNKFSMSYSNNHNNNFRNNNLTSNNYNINNSNNMNSIKSFPSGEFENKEEKSSNMNIVNLILAFMNKKGWIISLNEKNQYLAYATSIELFQFLRNHANNLNLFTIISSYMGLKIDSKTMLILLIKIFSNYSNNNSNTNDIGQTQ